MMSLSTSALVHQGPIAIAPLYHRDIQPRSRLRDIGTIVAPGLGHQSLVTSTRLRYVHPVADTRLIQLRVVVDTRLLQRRDITPTCLSQIATLFLTVLPCLRLIGMTALIDVHALLLTVLHDDRRLTTHQFIIGSQIDRRRHSYNHQHRQWQDSSGLHDLEFRHHLSVAIVMRITKAAHRLNDLF